MSNKTSYVTKEGLKKLQEELDRLQKIEAIIRFIYENPVL